MANRKVKSNKKSKNNKRTVHEPFFCRLCKRSKTYLFRPAVARHAMRRHLSLRYKSCTTKWCVYPIFLASEAHRCERNSSIRNAGVAGLSQSKTDAGPSLSKTHRKADSLSENDGSNDAEDYDVDTEDDLDCDDDYYADPSDSESYDFDSD
ncbi:uncharacterized protein LOC141615293 [Silene latifolia]|uniref:uncharacterized protein LOC141615293 n=1 Tax=Silene latifolia TaxID=37657 RepID=UPI003D77979A